MQISNESKYYSGGCRCGAIRFKFSDNGFRLALNCHCRDCQHAGGSAYASIVIVAATAFDLVRGVPQYYEVNGDSGHHVSRGFCRDCGSQLLGKIREEADKVIIQAGSLDDSSWHRPVADIYVSRAQSWDVMEKGRMKAETLLTEDQLISLRLWGLVRP